MTIIISKEYFVSKFFRNFRRISEYIFSIFLNPFFLKLFPKGWEKLTPYFFKISVPKFSWHFLSRLPRIHISSNYFQNAVLSHSPYSLDLALWDFGIFPILKKPFCGCHFMFDDEVVNAANTFFNFLDRAHLQKTIMVQWTDTNYKNVVKVGCKMLEIFKLGLHLNASANDA